MEKYMEIYHLNNIDDIFMVFECEPENKDFNKNLKRVSYSFLQHNEGLTACNLRDSKGL